MEYNGLSNVGDKRSISSLQFWPSRPRRRERIPRRIREKHRDRNRHQDKIQVEDKDKGDKQEVEVEAVEEETPQTNTSDNTGESKHTFTEKGLFSIPSPFG